MSLMTRIDQRSYGSQVKLYTWYCQGISALVFIPLSFFLIRDKPYFILFLFEGIGQIFLTLQNKSSLEKGDLQVSYFKKSNLSNFALFSFSLVVGARLWLLSSLLPQFSLSILSVGIVSLIFWYLLFFKGIFRRDALSGSFITLSSLILGLAYIATNSDIFIGINFLSYSLLMLIGTLSLKPWAAEILNIFLWIHLASLVLL